MANKSILTACLLLVLLVIAFSVEYAMPAQGQGLCSVDGDCISFCGKCIPKCFAGQCSCSC
ncbi:hypothetical protein B296_00056154 [Ensete ventricosum]|uniref:Uncharacterized protein n=1 Tax=Ensete ventricosum TaxID=4639 RepID=A0A426X9R0_ENSVE|nr:hypothetical protein B296_00056154 [Ensete ventricosum]